MTVPRAAHQREGHERFTLDRILAEEVAVLDLVDVRDDRTQLWIKDHDTAGLSPDQQTAVENIGPSPWLVQPLSALAGAGKTTSLRALGAGAHRWSTGRVLAPTGKAVDVALREGAGDTGMAIAKALQSLQDNTLQITRRTLVVVDEAAMVRTDDLRRLLTATTAGAKTVLVGDAHQLAPVKVRGGMFAQLCDQRRKALDRRQETYESWSADSRINARFMSRAHEALPAEVEIVAQPVASNSEPPRMADRVTRPSSLDRLHADEGGELARIAVRIVFAEQIDVGPLGDVAVVLRLGWVLGQAVCVRVATAIPGVVGDGGHPVSERVHSTHQGGFVSVGSATSQLALERERRRGSSSRVGRFLNNDKISAGTSSERLPGKNTIDITLRRNRSASCRSVSIPPVTSGDSLAAGPSASANTSTRLGNVSRMNAKVNAGATSNI
jgi:hypothetical protein